MIKQRRNISAPFPIEDLFAIAQDVENYPHFLPHCVAARILDKSQERWVVQNLYRWGPASYKFITLADVKPHSHIHIVSDPKEGIQLDVLWKFKAKEKAHTNITFEMGFSSNIPLLEKLVSAMLAQIAQQTETSFLKRAKVLS